VEAVRERLTVRAAAKQFNVVCTTLQRHLDHRCGKEQFPYSKKCAVWAVFSKEEEGKLINYYS
jgi:hypothetical protein